MEKGTKDERKEDGKKQRSKELMKLGKQWKTTIENSRKKLGRTETV